jgi:signal transduction histidine kinase
MGALLTACVPDVLMMSDVGFWPVPAVLVAGLTAVLWPAARRPRWLLPQVRAAVPALASGAYTAGTLLRGGEALFGPGEVAILLCALFIAVRHCPQRWAVGCGVLAAGALLAMPLRYLRLPSSGTLGLTIVGLVLVGLSAGLAAYLRSVDYRRTLAIAETRRAERLDLAADLHDFVAHHVTGVVVQAQMARMMATEGPDELTGVLAGIERAATDALASMRRTVGVLRDAGPDEADHRPVGDLADICELAQNFPIAGQKVTLHLDPALPDGLPPEVQTAAFRTVQEALTNVRRHAADATEITIDLRHDGRRLTVTVTDDGRGGTQLPYAAHGGGFGLVGLTERVTALGGELHAGPQPGHGWQLRALLPAGQG